jgi:carboxylate-amine ligase
MCDASPLHLFEGFGVELEYMIVDADTLSVLPVADEVIHAVAGEYVTEVEMGQIAWSNELVLHVIELKTNGPAASLNGLPQAFAEQLIHLQTLLEPLGGCLLPTAMHPWMDPLRDARLWPHEYNPIYETYNRIFDCRGHGWANLQSVHLNLPFADDAEFGRLHAAIRLLLPIMPALAASSTNSQRIPAITGGVIPEPVFSQYDYETYILQRLYKDIAPYDPNHVLQYEWLNARGAIARFDRNSIEIRVLDVQECPVADLAICQALSEVLQALIAGRWTALHEQQAWPVEPLHAILLDCIRGAEQAVIRNPGYLHTLGFPEPPPCSAGELWQHLLESTTLLSHTSPWSLPLQVIIEQGPLARRLLRAWQGDPSRQRLYRIYRELSTCLATGRMFSETF